MGARAWVGNKLVEAGLWLLGGGRAADRDEPDPMAPVTVSLSSNARRMLRDGQPVPIAIPTSAREVLVGSARERVMLERAKREMGQ